MTEIQYVQSRADIPVEAGWVNKENFKKKDLIITANDGRTYTLEVKKIVYFSPWERLCRAIIGCIRLVPTLLFARPNMPSVFTLFTKETKESRTFAVLKRDPASLPPAASGVDKAALQPNSPQASPADSTEPKSFLDFYTQTAQLSFWDSYLECYIKSVSDPSWDTSRGLLFLHDELSGIKGSLIELQKGVQRTVDECQYKRKGSADDLKGYEAMLALRDQVAKVAGSLEEPLLILQRKIQAKGELKSARTDKPQAVPQAQGLYNVGNTCYMNSALQPLLAAANFTALVPEIAEAEPEETFAKRQNILDAFKTFLQAWTDKKHPNVLGANVGHLRSCIFQAGLDQGGFIHQDDERDYQDAGQFFELILHVIGRGFTLECTKIPVLDDGRKLNGRKRVEVEPHGVFYLEPQALTYQQILQGETEQLSIQELVTQSQNARAKKFTDDNMWRVEHPDTQKEIYLANYEESEKIVGPAPEILVIRVNNRIVNPEQDSTVNFGAIFKTPPDDSTYELVGFSQNHRQVHWTSVVRNNDGWKCCNDDSIVNVQPGEGAFRHPAHYMVYKKKAIV